MSTENKKMNVQPVWAWLPHGLCLQRGLPWGPLTLVASLPFPAYYHIKLAHFTDPNVAQCLAGLKACCFCPVQGYVLACFVAANETITVLDIKLFNHAPYFPNQNQLCIGRGWFGCLPTHSPSMNNRVAFLGPVPQWLHICRHLFLGRICSRKLHLPCFKIPVLL